MRTITTLNICLLFIICLISSTQIIYAQEVAITESAATATEQTSNNIERPLLNNERMGSTTERIENFLENQTVRKEFRQERQAVLNSTRQQRVLNLSANLSNRFDAAGNRILAIITRLESRINKLNTAGFDTNQAAIKLHEASEAVSRAKSTLTNIDKLVSEATSSTEPQKRWQDVREIYKSAADDIKLSHSDLREVIALLKISLGNESDELTTSTTSEETVLEVTNQD